MQPLVQSAIDAARRGENNKALELCKQALAANPDDVDAWLVVAAVVEQPERKRQCLNRVLTLDPTNQIARDELLQMDRLAMCVPPVQPTIAPVSPGSSLPSTAAPDSPGRTAHYYPDPLRTAAEVEQLESEKALNELKKKPFVFTGPAISGRVFNYFYAALFICVRFLAAALKVSHSTSIAIWVFLILGWACFLALRTVLSAPKIELRDSGIHTSTLLAHSAMDWSDIVSLKSTSKRLKLISNRGKSISISTQVEDYPVVAEIIRLKRPDLFGGGLAPTQGKPSAPVFEQPLLTSTPVFTGARTFRKSFFKQYILTLGGILYCLLLTWVATYATSYEHAKWDVITVFAFLLVASLGVLMVAGPFFVVSSITVESNKLTARTFFGETEISPSEIKGIKIGSAGGQNGRFRNFVNIKLFDGRHYGMSGSVEGEEIVYGFLMNWWNAYRNK